VSASLTRTTHYSSLALLQQYDPVEKSASDESARSVKMLDRILTTQEGTLNVEKAIKHTKGGKGRRSK